MASRRNPARPYADGMDDRAEPRRPANQQVGPRRSAAEGRPAGPRWLDEDQQATWRQLAGVIIRLPAVLDAQLQRDAGISHFEYLALSSLSTAGDRTMRMSELAALIEGSLPRLSQVVSRLERRGWVRRTPDPADGRYTLAILTDQGWDKVVASAPGHVEAVRDLVFDNLTKAQQRQLAEITARLMRAIDRAVPEAAGSPPVRGHHGRAQSGRDTYAG
jgi:DNA-binding MarR family transcriptional regulator